MTAPLRFFDFDKYGLEINHIYNEDCLEGMKKIKDKSVDMILCDLPYGTTQNKWDSIIPLDRLWEQYERVIKDNGAIVLTAAQPFTSHLISSNLKLFKYSLVWDKKNTTGFLNAKRMPLRRHEDIVIFYKKKPTYNTQMEIRGKERKKGGANRTNRGCYGDYGNTDTFNNEYYPTSIIEISNADKKNIIHPTQKPVEMFEYLIRTYTEPGAVVLDNCMGSGTTAVACIQLGRNFVGFENDTEHGYYETAMQRIKEVWHENRSH
jgi:site-specific DNA-methyltransferase (adenine-specific)